MPLYTIPLATICEVSTFEIGELEIALHERRAHAIAPRLTR
jgi:hypothetical protein